MSEFNNFIANSNYDDAEQYLERNRNTKLVERLLNIYIENKFLIRFFSLYEKQNDNFKKKENILTLVINYYYEMNDLVNMRLIIDHLKSINELKRRHIIFIFNFMLKNDMDECFRIIEQHHQLFKMEDFQKFFNVCTDMNLIKKILILIKDKPYIFNDLKFDKTDICEKKCVKCDCELYYKKTCFDRHIRKITETSPKKFTEFINFIQHNEYDVVVDTANIFYYTLNKHNPQVNQQSFDFLNIVIANLKKHFSNILLIIHQRHSKILNNTFFHKYKKMFRDNLTFWSPYGMNDDYFSLIACWYKYPVPIVTQDLFRDHKFFLGDEDIIQWYNDMNIKYFENGNIKLNDKFSVIIQQNEERWHIPYENSFICI